MTRRRAAHLTSVHGPTDNRIRLKECAALSAAGWDVVLVAPSPSGGVGADGVRLRAVAPGAGRLRRMMFTARSVYRAGLKEDADIYQFHDPELLPWAVLLRLRGKRVIYDVHEDVAGTVGYKTYLPPIVRPLVAGAAEVLERVFARACTAVVAATPHLGERARRFGRPVAVVQNFPRIAELSPPADALPYREREPLVVYVGVLSPARGAREMVDAIGAVSTPGAELHLAGRWLPAGLRDEIRELPGWARVREHGELGRAAVAGLLARSRVGVVTIWPERNYLMSYATKMFEYMAAGLPVVASDFPLWREIVDGAGCGVLVNPRDPGAIAAAVDRLLADPAAAEAMGARGRAAVASRYDWDLEAAKLVGLYDSLCPDGAPAPAPTAY